MLEKLSIGRRIDSYRWSYINRSIDICRSIQSYTVYRWMIIILMVLIQGGILNCWKSACCHVGHLLEWFDSVLACFRISKFQSRSHVILSFRQWFVIFPRVMIPSEVSTLVGNCCYETQPPGRVAITHILALKAPYATATKRSGGLKRLSRNGLSGFAGTHILTQTCPHA